jgi:prolyl 4-hydroxylase
VPNPWTIHAGMPVVRGVKYIITKWYRTRRWY